MSISYDAKVIVGFALDIVDVEVPKTKYDPDTGDPYQTTEFSHECATVGGVEVIPNFGHEETYEGMEIIESGYTDGQLFLGVVMARVSERESFTALVDEDFIKRTRVAREFAAKHGLKERMFLVMSCG